MMSAVIAIGKEIVKGYTLDSNSHFISFYLSRLGFDNRFIFAVDDVKPDIIEIIKLALDKADIVITTGGLGPTFDDMTLEAVAEALGRNLYLDQDALEFIEDFYTKLYKSGKIDSPGLNEKRKKMAYLIEGCKPIKNPVGAAWGCYVKDQNKHVFCLPGLPKEMKPMFENYVVPVLQTLSNTKSQVKEFYVDINDESTLGEYIDRVMKELDVYIKSLPEGFENKRMLVRVIAYGKSELNAEQKVNQAIEKLLNYIKNG